MIIERLHRERPRPACGVERLTKLGRHAVHAYHNVTPWSQDEQRFVYVDVTADGAGRVVIHDFRDGSSRIICDHACYNFHTGAEVRWLRGDQAVFCSAYTDASRTTARSAIIDLASGELQFPEALRDLDIRQTYERGRIATFEVKRTTERVAAVAVVDLTDYTRDTVFDAHAVSAALPAAQPLAAADMEFSHPLLSPDQRLLYVKVMRLEAGAERYHSSVVYDRQTDRFHWHDATISGHPIWHSRDSVIYNILQTRDGSDYRYIVAIDPCSGDYERFIDTPIPGPSHLDISPDGRWLILDGFTMDQTTSPLYRIDLETRSCRELLRLRHRHELADYYSFWRGQPHPAYSPSATRFAVNCNGGGDEMDILLITPPVAEGEE